MPNLKDLEVTSTPCRGQSSSDSDDERNRVNELFSSIRNGNLFGVRELLEEGVKTDVRDRNNKDNTPLHYAIEKCRKEIVEELLLPKWKTDINTKNSKGNTALHIAASKNKKDFVQLILNCKAQTEIRNHEGKTPRDLANDVEIENILKQALLSSLNAELLMNTNNLSYCSQRDTNGHSQLTAQRSSLDGGVNIETEESKTFPSRPGTSSISGHLYEIHLCMLFLLQALIKHADGKIETFRLATNVDGLMDFDDIFFEYSFKELDGKDQVQKERSKTIFLQAKHIDVVEKKKITPSVLLSRSTNKTSLGWKFSLNKYFNSYCSLKKNFSNNEPHPIFRNRFEDADREFIIYTNALSDFRGDYNHNFKKVEIEEGHILHLETRTNSNNYHELIFSGNEIENLIDALQCSADRNETDKTEPLSGEPNHELKQPHESLTSIESASTKKSEMREFLSKFKIFVDQPNEELVSEIIKEKIQSFYEMEQQDASSVFSEVRTKVENWWKNKKRIKEFLTENNRYFQDSVRVSILFNVKKPVDLFTGRSQDLIDLHNLMQGRFENGSKIMVISGLGGIGKTELARQYIYKHSGSYDDNVIWINAESESSLTESFILLARDKLRISTKNSNEEEKDIKIIVQQVYSSFSKRKSLFIFDNADKSEYLRTFLPQCPTKTNQHKPDILITSRNQEWEREVGVISLKELDIKDAIEFVKKGLNISGEDTSNREEIRDLVTKLQCFPLAIQQSIAYIADQNVTRNFSVSNYLTEYEKKKKDILSSQLFADRIDNDYTKTTFTTWKMSVDKIHSEKSGELALRILNIIAYFRRENITRQIFLHLADNDEEALRSAVRLLVKYSLVRAEQHQSILSIHSLVQEVTMLQLKESEKEEEILILALQLVETMLNSDTVTHAMSVFNYASKYNELLKKYAHFSSCIITELLSGLRYSEVYSFATEVLKLLRELKSDFNILYIELFTKNSIALILFKQGKYDESLRIWKELYVIQKEKFGENHADTLLTKGRLAQVLFAQGEYEEALKSYEEILDTGKEVLTEYRFEALQMRLTIADILLRLGKPDEALQSLKEILTAQVEIFGENSYQAWRTKESIADVLFSKDDYMEALKIYREQYEITKSVLGDESTKVVDIMKKIAKGLTRQGEYEEALTLFTKILNTENKCFPEDRIDILHTKYLTAKLHSRMGDNAKALEIFEEVFREMKEMLGPSDLKTLSAQQSIADILSEKGEYGKAFQHYDNVLKHRISILGPDHIDVLTTYDCIGNLLLKEGKYPQGLQVLEDVYKKRKCLFGELNVSTLFSKNHMAMALHYNGRSDKALEIYREILSAYKTLFGDKHPHVLTTYKNITLILSEKGEEEEALKILENVARDQAHVLGETHPDTLKTETMIAKMYRKLHKPEEALNILSRIMKIQEKRNDYASVLETRSCIATLWAEKGNCDRALHIYQEVLDQSERNPRTLVIRRNTASILLIQGKHKEAIKIFREVLKNEEEILCPQHPDIKYTREWLGIALNEIGWSRLHLAAYDGDQTEITSILDEEHDINCSTKDDFKPLHLAVENNNKETVSALISYSKKKHPQQLCLVINDRVRLSGKTPLHMSVENDNQEIVEILLMNGAHYDLKDEEGKVPLDLARPGSYIENLLLCIDGLFRAVQNGEEDEMNALLETQQNLNTVQAILNTQNRDELTIINVADKKGRKDIVEKLVDALRNSPTTT